jgi:nicotinamide mononucleotide (NMN) deamidase PncC
MSARASQLHANPWSGVFYITGGGSQLISELLSTPGASRSVLEVSVPYANSALSDLLGHAPAQACSAATARAMAMVAFQRASHLAPTSETPAQLFGLSCTASLATDREKRGKHRAHLAIQTQWHTHFVDVELSGDRAEEEAQLLDALWEIIEQALSEDQTASMAGLVSVRAHASWHQVLLGEIPAAATKAHGGQLILSGSFNPIHHGHRKMLALAEQLTGRAGAFELSITNVDKPPLDYYEIGARLAQFEAPVWLTRLPTFFEKARLFPGAVFAVGVDTMIRIDALRYYTDSAHRDAAIAELAALKCAFLVFGREADGHFIQLRDLDLSSTLRDICTEVPLGDFREDISSTALRQRDGT